MPFLGGLVCAAGLFIAREYIGAGKACPKALALIS